MRILLRDIPEEGVSLEGRLSPMDYDLPVDEYRKWSDIDYSLKVNLLGTECVVMGELTTEVTASCARCLEDFPIKIQIKEFNHSYDVSDGTESIDLTRQIREDILLDLPFAPKCRLDADFRCPITGQEHREQDDKFAELNRESVWGTLENLKKKKKE